MTCLSFVKNCVFRFFWRILIMSMTISCRWLFLITFAYLLNLNVWEWSSSSETIRNMFTFSFFIVWITSFQNLNVFVIIKAIKKLIFLISFINLTKVFILIRYLNTSSFYATFRGTWGFSSFFLFIVLFSAFKCFTWWPRIIRWIWLIRIVRNFVWDMRYMSLQMIINHLWCIHPYLHKIRVIDSWHSSGSIRCFNFSFYFSSFTFKTTNCLFHLH